MYTLYYSPGACSLAVHVLLNETGAEYEIKKAADQAAEFKTHNPRGAVPVLLVDGQVLREGAAILTFIAEEEKSPLLPSGGFEKAKAQEWLAFANSSMHPKYGTCFGAKKKLGDDAAKNPLYQASVEAIVKQWEEIEQELQSKDYICGKDITLADILLTVIAAWSPRISSDIVFGVRTQAWLERVRARPCFQKALASEGLQTKAAA